MGVYACQPVALNGKLYVRGKNRGTVTLLKYTPDHDQWAELPPPPVQDFTVATLRGQLLVVGGRDKSTNKTTNAVLTFDEHSQQWVQSYPAMPTAIAHPAVIVYQDHLIVAGGHNSNDDQTPDVNILDADRKWKIGQPLPSTNTYRSVLIQETVYLVGQYNKTVLRAHAPTLISGANKTGVWETLRNTPYYFSSPITIGDTLLTVGGSDKALLGGNPITSIQMYDPTNNQWTRVDDLPEPMESPNCVMNSELFVLGFLFNYSGHVYTSKLTLVN